MTDDKETIQGLVEVLLDPEADECETDDAAIDLGNYDDDYALNALVFAASRSHICEWSVLESIGGSIFEIWNKRNLVSTEIYDSLKEPAKVALFSCIYRFRPEWIEKYNIKID